MKMMTKNGEGATGAAADEKLFEMLKEIRQKEARKKHSAVCDLSGNFFTGYGYPVSRQHTTELEKCQGVSKGKALRYGKPFVELIAKYVEENEIERPDDFVMKSVVNKSSNKVYIIQR